jgi:hypothetical protein
MLQFAVTDAHVFTRHSAWKPNRDAPNGPWQIDESREYFFIVRKIDDGVEGPLNSADFAKHPATQISELGWKTPRTPGDSPWDGIIAGLVMCLAAFGLFGPFGFLIPPLLTVLIAIILFRVVRLVRRQWSCKRALSDRVL